MKLLLDENLPHQLRLEIPGHECFTVTYMGLSGVTNGRLLQAAAGEGFDAVLTKDANIEYEQNLAALTAAVVVLRAASNDIEDIRPLIPILLQTLESLVPNKLTVVDVPVSE